MWSRLATYINERFKKVFPNDADLDSETLDFWGTGDRRWRLAALEQQPQHCHKTLDRLEAAHFQPLPTCIVRISLEFKSLDFVVLIAYLDSKDSASSGNFSAISKALPEGFLARRTFDQEAAKLERMRTPSIALFRSFGKEKFDFEGRFEKRAIDEFIQSSMKSSIEQLEVASSAIITEVVKHFKPEPLITNLTAPSQQNHSPTLLQKLSRNVTI